MIKLGWQHTHHDKDHRDRYVDLETFARIAYELKLDVIDLEMDRGFLSKDPDTLLRFRMRCLKYGLPIGYVGYLGHFAASEEEGRTRLEKAKETVDVAAFLGADMIRVFAGGGHVAVENRDVFYPPMIRRFQEAADYAAEKGMVVGLQNHDNQSLAMTGDDVLQILGDVDRENFTHIMDTGQWLGSIGAQPRDGSFDLNVDIYKYMEQTAPYATCVRAKIYKIDQGREEWIDYRRVFQILKAVDFNGSISIVFEGRELDGSDRNRCDDREAVRLAIEHLRELLARNP